MEKQKYMSQYNYIIYAYEHMNFKTGNMHLKINCEFKISWL